MDWLDYREKLGIGFDDEQKVALFIIKIFNVLNSLLDSSDIRSQISNDEYFVFCNMTGTITDQDLFHGDGFQYIMRVLQHHTEKLPDFLSYYMAFLNCQKDHETKPLKRIEFRNILTKMLKESHIHYEVFEDADGFFVFPKGVDEMDAALISQPLTWLVKYPSTEKAWIKALKRYADSSETDASDIADLFRKALESFFQEFFGNKKTLENNKAEYGNHLKSKGIPKELCSNFETLLQSYTNYMNNYAKHRDATSDKALEYIMYQTGNIMRLLITL